MSARHAGWSIVALLLSLASQIVCAQSPPPAQSRREIVVEQPATPPAADPAARRLRNTAAEDALPARVVPEVSPADAAVPDDRESRRQQPPLQPGRRGRAVDGISAERVSALAPLLRANLLGSMARLPPATELEVWDGRDQPPSEFFRVSAGPAIADKNRENLLWYFRATSRIAANRAVYQISHFPFPADANDPLKVAGLLKQGEIDAWPQAGGMRLFRIDFSPYVVRYKLGSAGHALQTPASRREAVERNLMPDRELSGERQDSIADTTRTRRDLDRNLRRSAQWGPLVATFHVRVLALDASGGVIGSPSNAVELRLEELLPEDNFQFAEAVHPGLTLSSYRPVRPDRWEVACQRRYVGPTLMALQTGMIVDSCSGSDDSILDQIGDAIAGFAGALGDFVNAVAATYEWAKQQAVALAVAALDELGVPCPCPIGSCADCVSRALDYGLASIGLPPSLPDFDQLVNEGVDYLAASIAAQTQLPIEEAVAVAKELARQNASGHGSGSGNIWQPVEEYMYSPLLLRISVAPNRNPARLIIDNPDGRYRRADVPLPPSDTTLLVPVALEPTSPADGWRALWPTLTPGKVPTLNDLAAMLQQRQQAIAALADWTARHTQGRIEFEVRSVAMSGLGPSTKLQFRLLCSAGKPQCAIVD